MEDFHRTLGRLAVQRNSSISLRTALFVMAVGGTVYYTYCQHERTKEEVKSHTTPMDHRPETHPELYSEYRRPHDNNTQAAFDPTLDVHGKSALKQYELFPKVSSPLESWAVDMEESMVASDRNMAHRQYHDAHYQWEGNELNA